MWSADRLSLFITAGQGRYPAWEGCQQPTTKHQTTCSFLVSFFLSTYCIFYGLSITLATKKNLKQLFHFWLNSTRASSPLTSCSWKFGKSRTPFLWDTFRFKIFGCKSRITIVIFLCICWSFGPSWKWCCGKLWQKQSRAERIGINIFTVRRQSGIA